MQFEKRGAWPLNFDLFLSGFFFCLFRCRNFSADCGFPPKSALRATSAGKHLELLSTTSFASDSSSASPTVVIGALPFWFHCSRQSAQLQVFHNSPGWFPTIWIPSYFGHWNPPPGVSLGFPEVMSGRSANLCLAGATDYKSLISILFSLFPMTHWNTNVFLFLRICFSTVSYWRYTKCILKLNFIVVCTWKIIYYKKNLFLFCAFLFRGEKTVLSNM